MEQLRSSSELVGDPDGLRGRFARDGYVYLQGVLDPEVISGVRGEMERLLIERGFARPAADGPRFTGKTTGRSPIRSPRELESEYNNLGLARRIVDHPAHRALFNAVAGEDVDFLPITEYRTRPPGNEPLTWHQDGFYNRGLDLFTAWIPLTTMTEEIGGLAVAEGMHNNGYLHEAYPPPRYLIDADDIPQEVQRTVQFEPGDILIFDRRLPHTGLPNSSTDRFRFSVDVRFQGVSKRNRIAVGHIRQSSANSLTIATDGGDTVTLSIAPESQLRDWWGNDVAPDSVGSSALSEGKVLAAQHDGTLIMARPVT
jgi:Phytanoyl-CoA dioxygenase (PhyH)